MAKKAQSSKKDDKKAAKKPAAKAAAPAKAVKAKAAAKPVKAKAEKPVKEKLTAAKAPKKMPPVEIEVFEEAADEQTEESTEAVPATVKAPKVKKVKAPSARALAAAAAEKKASDDETRKWQELQEKFADEKPSAYNMSAQFESQKPIQHKVLGWGFILTNNNDRLEVLFETGTRMLISNYNPGKK